MADDAVGGSEIPAGAMEAVREFLRYAVDERDAEKARAYLSAASLAAAMDEIPEDWRGGTYEIGRGTREGDQVWVLVDVANDDQKLKVPFAPVQEEGAWKLDLGKTMEKLMGGMMSDAVGQMASAVGDMMAGVGEALGGVKDAVGSAISGVLGSQTPGASKDDAASHRKQTAKNVKKALAVKRPGAAKKKTPARKPVARTHGKAAKIAKTAKKSAVKKAKPAKKSKAMKKAPSAKKTKKRK